VKKASGLVIVQVLILYLLSGTLLAEGKDPAVRAIAGLANEISQSPASGSILRNPGEITFTQAAVIEGRVEKPQVVFTILKQGSKSDSIIFDQSFREEILSPLEINAFNSIEIK
jgi:hypothetical protein